MKTIGDRISLEENSEKTTIIISPKLSEWRETILVAWFIAWTVCGGIILSQLISTDLEEKRKIYFVVFIAFWAYFEYKVGHAVLWRKWGHEYIKVIGDSIYIKKAIKGYGKSHRYFVENINEFAKRANSNKSFTQLIENSDWYVGGDSIHFKYQGRVISMGRQLNDEDATKLELLLSSKIKQLIRQEKKNQSID